MIDTPSSSTVTVAIGSSLTLSCTSRGSPPDTFTWRKDNDPTVLQSTSITSVDHTSTNAVFHANYSIDNVTTSDSGTYTCTVANPIGNDNTTITVAVSGKLLVCSSQNYISLEYRYLPHMHACVMHDPSLYSISCIDIHLSIQPGADLVFLGKVLNPIMDL